MSIVAINFIVDPNDSPGNNVTDARNIAYT